MMDTNNEMIDTTRTAIEVRQRCRQERFLGFHYNGVGLEKKAAKYEAKFGSILHDAMKGVMRMAQEDPSPKRRYDIVNEVEALLKVLDVHFGHLEEKEFLHLKEEQTALLMALVGEWSHRRLPAILREYYIVDVEMERVVVFAPEDYLPPQLAQLLRPLRIPFRFDVVLRRKSDDLLFVFDFKTASRVSGDWNINLDNSTQSHLYIEAARLIYNEPIGGIFYGGMVKGYREKDGAKSSPYNGYILQYGSFLYGWKDKFGEVHSDYATGRRRQELWSTKKYAIHNLDGFFPITIPWKPLNIGQIVGQTIVAENGFKNDLEMYNECGVHSPEKALYEQVLFEKSLGMCHKYGTKFPCQFVSKCHGVLHEDDIKQLYDVRVPHHKEVE